MATLLIWEEIPERTRLFVIPEENAAPIQHLLAEAHGNYLNSDKSNPGLEFVLQAVNNYDSSYDGQLLKYEVDMNHPLEYHTGSLCEFITHVYHSGFVL